MCLLDLLVNILYFLPEGNTGVDMSRRQAEKNLFIYLFMKLNEMVPPPVACAILELTAATSSTHTSNPGKCSIPGGNKIMFFSKREIKVRVRTVP